MAANFRVTGQRPSSRVTPTAQIERTVEVSFETIPYAIAGTVEIPASQYGAQAVNDIVAAKAVEMIAVQDL